MGEVVRAKLGVEDVARYVARGPAVPLRYHVRAVLFLFLKEKVFFPILLLKKSEPVLLRVESRVLCLATPPLT